MHLKSRDVSVLKQDYLKKAVFFRHTLPVFSILTLKEVSKIHHKIEGMNKQAYVHDRLKPLKRKTKKLKPNYSS